MTSTPAAAALDNDKQRNVAAAIGAPRARRRSGGIVQNIILIRLRPVVFAASILLKRPDEARLRANL